MNGRQLLDAMEYIDAVLIEEAAPLSDASRKMPGRKRAAVITAAAAVAAAIVAAVSLWAWQSKTSVSQTTDTAQNFDMAANTAIATADSAAASEGVAADSAAAEEADYESESDAENAEMKEEADVEVEGADQLSASDYSMLLFTEADTAEIIEGEMVEGVGAIAVCYAAPEKGEYFLYEGLRSAIDEYDSQADTAEETAHKNYVYHVAIDIFGDVADGDGTVYEELRLSEEGRELLLAEYQRLLESGLNVSLSEEYELTGLLDRAELEGFEPCADYGYAFRFINEY